MPPSGAIMAGPHVGSVQTLPLEHWLFRVHDVRQLSDSHLYAPQEMAAPALLQTPAPLQVCGCTLSPSQTDPQLVPEARCLQPPFPSQVPTLPQAPLAGQLLPSFTSSATFTQTPGVPALPHVLHGPHELVEQQRPSTQLPESHSAPALQVPPNSFLPPHMLPTQSPETQSLLMPQVVLHEAATALHL